MDIQDTMERLRKLSAEPFVGAETTIRLAVIEFLLGQTDSALVHLKAAVPSMDDSYLLNLDWLMQGLIATSRGDEPFALTAYRSAFAARAGSGSIRRFRGPLRLRRWRSRSAKGLMRLRHCHVMYGPSSLSWSWKSCGWRRLTPARTERGNRGRFAIEPRLGLRVADALGRQRPHNGVRGDRHPDDYQPDDPLDPFSVNE
jgi:hypothetical protein